VTFTVELIQSQYVQVRVRGFIERPSETSHVPDGSRSPVSFVEQTVVSSSDVDESSAFYQSMMAWKSLQEWAQRAWAKHYQQSPIGSTQNVEPIIVQGLSPTDVGLQHAVSHALDEQPGKGVTSLTRGVSNVLPAEIEALQSMLMPQDSVPKPCFIAQQSAVNVPKLTVDRNVEGFLPLNHSANRDLDDNIRPINTSSVNQSGPVPVHQNCRDFSSQETASKRSSKCSKSRCNYSSVFF
jgi:hypothetical protein